MIQETNQTEYVNEITDQLDQFSKLLDITIPNCLTELHGLVQAVLLCATNEQVLQQAFRRSKSLEKILKRKHDKDGLQEVRSCREEQRKLSIARLSQILDKIEQLKKLLADISNDLAGLKFEIRIHKKLALALESSERLQNIKVLTRTLKCHSKDVKKLTNIVTMLDGDMKKMKKKSQ